MTVITRLAQLALGLALLAFGFWSAHAESLSATRSIPLVIVYLALGVIGALLLPDIGAKLASAMQTGISLGAAGRRAYDGEVVAPPKDGGP